MQVILFLEDNKALNQKISKGLSVALGDHVRIISVYTITEARKMMDEMNVDLLILDIQLPDGSGIDFGYDVRKKDEEMPIMIISTYTTETLHAKLNNEINLLMCIKKPLCIEDIVPRLKSSLKQLKRKHISFVTFKSGREYIKIAVQMIVKVTTVKGAKQIEVMVYNNKTDKLSLYKFPMQSLEDFEKLLPNKNELIRIHQSTFVNPAYVISYDGATNELYLENTKEILSIGKTYRHTVGLLFGRMK